MWELSRGKIVKTLEEHTENITTITLTHDNQCVVSASKDRTLKIWELSSGQIVTTLEGHKSWVIGIAISHDNRDVVSSDHTYFTVLNIIGVLYLSRSLFRFIWHDFKAIHG